MEEQETGAAQLKLLVLFDMLYKKQTERRGVAANTCSEGRLCLSAARDGEYARHFIKIKQNNKKKRR